MIAVQLLATCFTLSPESERYSRSPAPYHDPNCPIRRSSDPRLISSLRLHTQFRNSPALGHNARNSSPAHAWSNVRNQTLREERLAEEISGLRRLRRLQDSQSRGNRTRGRGARSEDPSEDTERNSGRVVASTSPQRRNRSSAETTITRKALSQRRKIDRIYIPPQGLDTRRTDPLSHTSETHGARPIWRNNRGNALGSRRWSFQPVIRSEAHPVFIQPVKEHIIRRWRPVRPRPRSMVSKARSSKSLTRPCRKRTSTSGISSTDTTSGLNTASSRSNIGPESSSAPSPEAVDLDDMAQIGGHLGPNSLFSMLKPSPARFSDSITSPNSSAPLANDQTRPLVDDDAPFYWPPIASTLQSRSTTEQVLRRPTRGSSSNGTIFVSAPISTQTSMLPTESTGSSGRTM